MIVMLAAKPVNGIRVTLTITQRRFGIHRKTARLKSDVLWHVGSKISIKFLNFLKSHDTPKRNKLIASAL